MIIISININNRRIRRLYKKRIYIRSDSSTILVTVDDDREFTLIIVIVIFSRR